MPEKSPRNQKLTLAALLVSQGHCEDARQAIAMIMAGLVLVNGQPAHAGDRIRKTDKVVLKERLPFASRGGLKLQGALRAMGLDISGQVCLDAGASTGGFTDCLLRSGARLVYAVDVGYGQLTGALRQDSRVFNLEKTNISDPALLTLDPAPGFATCDLSYLSLREAVPVYRDILRNRGSMLALVKPLFEIQDSEARRSGQIGDAAYEPLLTELAAALNRIGNVGVMRVCESPVTGSAGTIEFFFLIRFGSGQEKPDLSQDISGSVSRALRLYSAGKAGEAPLGQTIPLG